jgi:hypothetical protein
MICSNDLKNSMIMHEEKTKEVTTKSVVLYVIKIIYINMFIYINFSFDFANELIRFKALLLVF